MFPLAVPLVLAMIGRRTRRSDGVGGDLGIEPRTRGGLGLPGKPLPRARGSLRRGPVELKQSGLRPVRQTGFGTAFCEGAEVRSRQIWLTQLAR